MRKLYYLCGLAIESEVDLAPVPVIKGVLPDLKLVLEHCLPKVPCQWFHERIMSDGTPWMSVGKAGSNYILRFPNIADFAVSTRGEITAFPTGDTTQQTLQHLFADQVMPLYLSSTGRTVLHASAVNLSGRAVAFLGRSGAGKSTLAASFCDEGAELVSDDCLLLDHDNDRLVCVPSYPGLRLWADSANGIFGRDDFDTVAQYGFKLRVAATSSFSTATVPVSRVYFLDPNGAGATRTAAISPVSSGDLFLRLVESSFRLEVTGREALEKEFVRLSRLVKMPLFRRLSYPKHYTSLSEVRRLIRRDACAGAP